MFEVLATAAAARIIDRAHELLDDLVADTVQIAQTPAPTGDEAARARLVAGRMAAIGVSAVEIDAVGNVVGRLPGRPGGGPALLLAAHLDTVFPHGTDLTVRRDGDLLQGPGVGDNAASVATMLQAARLLLESGQPLRGDVILAGTVGEEGLGNLRGIRSLMDRLADQVDYVVPLDGTLGGLVRQAVGSRRYRLVVAAEGGHSWGAFGAPSAIHSLCRMVARISDLVVPHHPKTTYNIGTIRGGTSVNTIAAHAEALLDLRSVDPVELQRLERRVQDIVLQIADQTGTCARLEPQGERPGGSIPDDHVLCRAVRAVHDRLGISTRTYASSTDANIPLSRGIPAVTIGVTVGGNGHREDEYLQVPPLARGLAQVALLVLAVQDLPPRFRQRG